MFIVVGCDINGPFTISEQLLLTKNKEKLNECKWESELLWLTLFSFKKMSEQNKLQNFITTNTGLREEKYLIS